MIRRRVKSEADFVRGRLMRGQRLVPHFSPWRSSPVFITALLSALILCWWLVPQKFALQDSAVRPASVDEDEMDASLQQAAVEALGARAGTIIVMDPQSGRLRAVVNPRLAFEQAFSPGSTVKPFTALTALQARLINEKSRLLCHERYVNDDFEIHCAHPRISAPFDLAHALGYSCNYYFGKLGERLDEDSFNATLSAFGFGARTHVNDAREETGHLPRGTGWRASHAIGEGQELRVTPIQLLAAYAALVNGGHLYIPQLDPARNFNKRERASLSIAPAHRAVLLEGMRGAITYGTAERAALSALSLYLFGKTGTTTASDSLQTQGWFIGFAAAEEKQAHDAVPESAAELAVLVFLKDAHGAECAEVSRAVFEAFVRERSRYRARARGQDGPPAPASHAPTSSAASQVQVYLAGEQRTVSVSLEDYILGVVAAEGAIEEEPEALKALAIAVRTYALRNRHRHAREGYDFCNTTHCQRYTFIHSGSKAGIAELIRRACTETAGEVLLDENGRLADAYFHAACGGMTANVETLWGGTPRRYLSGVRDEYCALMPHHDWTDVVPADRLNEALGRDARTILGARLENVSVSRRDATGRAELITLEGEGRRRVVRGWDFKIIVGRTLGWNVLKSSRFEVRRAGENFIFRGSGFGHGVGLCQEGAHVMARRGVSSRQILSHYFPGTSVGSVTPELDQTRPERFESEQGSSSAVSFRASGSALTWRADVLASESESQSRLPASLAAWTSMPFPRINGSQTRRLSLAGEHFRVSYTIGVEQRGAQAVLRTLEAARRDLLRRVSAGAPGFDGPQTLDVIIHLTTGDFVAATGQPSWAAAATRGRRIELQPLAVLLRRGVLTTTLRHEYAHAVIDALGQGRAPRWLAEGLAISFAGEGQMLTRFETKTVLSTDELERRLAHPASAADMRALYATAYRQVQALIRAEGERSVWQRLAREE